MGRDRRIVGRIAPSPSGLMHLGNAFSALLAWAFARSENGEFVVRLENLDERCQNPAYVKGVLDDLRWLGIEWDGEPFVQTERVAAYEVALGHIADKAELYPCFCSRADIRAASAPQEGDRFTVYPGTCRRLIASEPQRAKQRLANNDRHSMRIATADTTITFHDEVFGTQQYNLAHDIGDIIVRRSDGIYSYQLAVTVDDLDMGITDIVRGRDLLRSNALQIYIRKALINAGFKPSEPTQPFHPADGSNKPDDVTISYAHLPLIDNAAGQRLAKRERSLDLGILTAHGATAQQIIGYCAWLLGLQGDLKHTKPQPMSADEALGVFSWDAVRTNTSDRTLDQGEFNAYFGL